MPDLNYLPSPNRLLLTDEVNKQAQAIKGADELTEINALQFITNVNNMYDIIEQLYQDALSKGIPKELARIILPVGRYSRMRATANLRNWLAFLTLRCAPDAQYEIRMFANAVHEIIKENFPNTAELFDS